MRLILIAAGLLLHIGTYCQSKKSLPSFGKIDKADLEMNSCEFDKDAEAVVLFEKAKLYYDINGSEPYSEMQHHVRIKILTDKGLDKANIKLQYQSYLNAEGILNISATTYNLDASGNIVATKLEKNQVYQKRVTSRTSEQAFSFPAVKVGSIIEYKYTHRGYFYKNWFLQKSIPVKLSRYEIDFPSQFEMHTRPMCTLPYKNTDESTALRTIKVFSMENIPALRDEQYITCDQDYLQHIESYIVAVTFNGRRHNYLKTWQQISTLLLDDEDFGVQLKKEIPRTTDLDTELNKLNDPYQKMVTIYNYVRKNMKWDGVDNYWALSGVKAAWKEKSGTSGEINLILINLLRDADIKVHPIMVSTRAHGRISPLFPTHTQFNKVLAYVTIGENNYVLDGTDKFSPAGLIPQDVMFTEGMILDPSTEYKFRWQTLWDESRVDKNVVIFRGVIDSGGNMKGHATVTSIDYARTKRAAALSDKEKITTRFLRSGTSSLQLEKLEMKNEEIDSLPLVQDFDFNTAVNHSGDYGYFTMNLFSGMDKNPFVADNRFSDVFFGTKQTHQIIGNITIPEGYTFEELPKNLRLTLEDQSLVVTRILAASGNMINARMTVEFKRPFYTPEEYPDLKEFYKKMYALLDEQIVIKKK
jgi:hypothetical protein